MKLQLWTTNANGDAEEFLGEVDVTHEEWHGMQDNPFAMQHLFSDLHAEAFGEC